MAECLNCGIGIAGIVTQIPPQCGLSYTSTPRNCGTNRTVKGFYLGIKSQHNLLTFSLELNKPKPQTFGAVAKIMLSNRLPK